MAQRYIVRFRGAAPAKEISAKLHAGTAVHVVEETSRMMLVEAEQQDLFDVVRPSADVLIVPERHYEQPDPLPTACPEPSDPHDS